MTMMNAISQFLIQRIGSYRDGMISMIPESHLFCQENCKVNLEDQVKMPICLSTERKR